MLFDEYLFADYSGAVAENQQRRAIRLARASPGEPPSVVEARLTRAELSADLLARLRDASRSGRRICFGQDHQYSIPYALAQELSVHALPWRHALQALYAGSYGGPAFAHPRFFAAAFNSWLVERSRTPYFYSATKARQYGLPNRDPRDGNDSAYRMTERCRPRSGSGSPKPFNRVGDNGTVGGQSLVGMGAILELLAACDAEGVRVAVWPFDGPSIKDAAYAGAHVMIEPYPSAVRSATVAQNHSSDALASTAYVRELDASGLLADALDLSGLEPAVAHVASFEGWIISHQVPTSKRSGAMSETLRTAGPLEHNGAQTARVPDSIHRRRVFLDTCVLNFMLDHGEQIHDGAEPPDSPDREDVEALRQIWLVGQRAVWQLAISPHTYFEIVRTRDAVRLSALDRWFQEVWQYWRSTVQGNEDLPSFLEAEEMRVRTLASGVLACLPDVSDRVLVCDALVYGCDLFCTRDRSTILRHRDKLAGLPIEIVNPSDWWHRIQHAGIM